MSVAQLLLLATTACGAYLTYAYILVPCFFSPLARIPSAHWSCPISSIWLKVARVRDTELNMLERAHLHLGNIVRIAPNYVSICGIDHVRTVYQGDFEKAPMYKTSDNYGYPCLMSTIDAEQYLIRRRILSKVYSKSYTHNSASGQAKLSSIVFKRLLPHLKEVAATAGPRGMEAEPIVMATIIDSMSAHLFGLNNGTNFILDVKGRVEWLKLFYALADQMVWFREFPFFAKVCSRLGFRLDSPQADDAIDSIEIWNKDMCDKALAASASSEPLEPEDEPTVVAAMRDGFANEAKKAGSPFFGSPVAEQETMIASETMDEVLAGQDPATLLTYLLWHLANSIKVQDELRQELLSLDVPLKMNGADTCKLPHPRVLDSLPILNAAIEETLRLHPPLPYAERRLVPRGSCVLGKYQIPAGTQVAASPYIVHRDEAAYPDALRWDHTRWLGWEAKTEQHKKMEQQFWAFSSGGRGCIAKDFAYNQVKCIAAGIFANFRLTVVDDSGIKSSYTTMTSTGDGLFLRFTPL